MTNPELKKLKYPIGPYVKPSHITQNLIQKWILDIEQFPNKLMRLTENLSNEQKNWTYRPGGWTIKQVVHHCADSHMNSLIRFKLSLTEDKPTIKPYHEDRWAELPDAMDNDLSATLDLLKGLHGKWVFLLRNLSPEQMKREFIHPEYKVSYTLEENIGVYAWHCNHHLAHIKQALNK